MGKLVQFEGRKSGRTDGQGTPMRSAEILMFTGVRYERATPETPTKPTTTNRAKRRRG